MSFISRIISSSTTFSAELKKVMADRNQLHFFCSSGLLERHCEQQGKGNRKDILFMQMVHCRVLGIEYFQSKTFCFFFFPPLIISDKDELTLFMVVLLIYALKSRGNS